MIKIKNNALKISKSEYFPFIVFAFLLLFFHACIRVGWADDEWFLNIANNENIFNFVMSRYYNWTSRAIIEFVLISIVRFPFVWRILNAAITVLGAVSISKIFSYKNTKNINWIICALIFCTPMNLYNSAGWIATTLNYSWPLFLGLFSILPIKKIIYNEKINWYEYILYFAAMIYATNQEQMCCILLGTYFSFLVYLLFKYKKINVFMLFAVLINIVSFILTIINKGNQFRKEFSIKSSFPDFEQVNFFRKIEMGYSSTLFEFIMKHNFIFFIFTLLIFICVYALKRNKVFRLISLIPVGSIFIFGFLSDFIDRYFPGITSIKNSMTPYGTGITLFSPKTWVPDIILTLVCLSILFSLYVILENKKTYILTLFILTLGFASRMIMSFSPTIWVSGPRTCIFMYFSIIITLFILYQEVYTKLKRELFFVDEIIFVLSALL
ncbi:MAG: DUF6056 family protein, partial [Alphaproteobacteria bacterium]|nr:DUF6056 family protein [Alphaproteobacteria bacterium]